MAVENQVAVIYAVSRGHLDDVPVDKVRTWERGFHEHLNVHHGAVLDLIRTGKVLSDDVGSGLEAAIAEWNEAFAAQHATAGAPA